MIIIHHGFPLSVDSRDVLKMVVKWFCGDRHLSLKMTGKKLK